MTSEGDLADPAAENVCSRAQAAAIEIVANLAEKFTFASHQNSIPVIRAISIANASPDPIENLRLELTSSPAFLRAKTWTIDRVFAGDNHALGDRRVDLDPSYLAGLDEAEAGDIRLRLLQADAVVAETIVPVRLLARDEWGGVSDMAQLLPAFVMPNDPAIHRVLRSAAERLASHGHSSALDGYQSNDPKRAYMLAAAVYSAIAALGIHYAEPPASFERRGQKIRGPSKLIQDQLGTCLDFTLLFAAALEAVGLNAVTVLLDGHAFAGVWLVKRTLPNTIEGDVSELRKAIAAHELVVFETTGVTHRPAMTFEQARKVGEDKLKEDSPQAFAAAVDVARSRSSGILPLASHAPRMETAADETDTPAELPLPAEPDILMPTDLADEKPTTPEGRIERWRSRLLDLSLRNRLLNFSEGKRAIPFLCPDVADLEDRLAEGTAIKIISLPQQNPLGDRDPSLHRDRRGDDLHRTFAAEALKRDELSSKLEAKELSARLTDLYRQARNDLTEGGTNTLYLAVGILKWKKTPTDERVYRAPLLLLPVKLERSGASDRFRLKFHEDEPQLNATLLQFLKRDFDLSLPDFRGGLPQDDKGIDVSKVLDSIRRAVRDVPGFEVVDDIALSTFSFAKYLMWKDLTDRVAALRQNRVVKHLIDNPDRILDGADQPFPDAADIDRQFASADLVLPLPADSSQIAACLAAAQGRDFVIIGPPGTGKSQTIANMIAMCLAAGKTVLFVAEKTAALDVVYRRLREHRLGDHCLELHSSKADRKHFFGQLKNSWEKRAAKRETEWVTLNHRLQIRRDELNAYVDALHRQSPNGLTPYAAIGIATLGQDDYAPKFEWPSKNAHDAQGYRELEDLATELGRTYSAVKVRPVLRLLHVEEWTNAWQEKLLGAARALATAAAAAHAALTAISPRLGLDNLKDCRADGLKYFAELAKDLIATSGEDHTIILHRDFSALARALAELETAISAYRHSETKLSARYAPDTVARIPIADIERDWHEAKAAMWPKSWLGTRRVKRLLGSYAGTKTAAPGTDIGLLRDLQARLQSIRGNAVAETPLAFNGLDTDCKALTNHLEKAERLRTSLVQLGEFAGDVQRVAASIAANLKGQVNQPQLSAAKDYLARYHELQECIVGFEAIAGVPFEREHEDCLGTIVRQMDEIQQARSLFRDWSSWCSVRKRAIARGLLPLVEDIENGAVPTDRSVSAFRLGYARWWLPLAIDDSKELRSFRRFAHENAVEDFRAVDDLVRAHASDKIVSTLAHGLPASEAVPRQSELGQLRHQMGLKRPSRSIREMIAAMPESFSRLAPCVLMSPLSIAQYLPPDQALFDIVIFDEASQIATWDAVGAIARGRQTIIVGDPKQLPPTNFFGRADDQDDSVPEFDRDLESILDETRASGLPVRHLRWHYRSRHESLIAFSNWHYYDNHLVTFPSPVTEDRAVSLNLVPTGIYDRGKSRTNREEARAIAADIRIKLKSWLALPEAERPTIGVITFNAQQQALIQDLLDEVCRAEPDLEWFFSDDRIEPVIVKNLENIQGDERDVIYFSITFCRDAAGKLPMNFGAINNDGGERRLNVAVTRARTELRVFSGIRADDIDLDRSKAVGVRHLKAFLDYASRGAIALPAQDEGSLGGVESPFEQAVATALQARGWQVATQVGVSGFRIDLGIRHPDHAGLYLAGIECDGATYHSSATARDRDKVREQVLRGLGWNILRIWSTDWWFSAADAIERIHAALNDLLAASRSDGAATANSDNSESETETDFPEGIDLVASTPAPQQAGSPADGDNEASGGTESPVPRPPAGSAGEVRIASLAPFPEVRATFRIVDLSGFKAEAERFFEFSYRPTIEAMIDAVMAAEAPVREDVLAQRIARAHGWSRTGARIRDQVSRHLENYHRTDETPGSFLWLPGTVAERLAFRRPHGPDHRRPLAEIALAELVDFILTHAHALDEDDPPLVYARLLDIERLAALSRERLQEAIENARASSL